MESSARYTELRKAMRFGRPEDSRKKVAAVDFAKIGLTTQVFEVEW